MEKRSLFCYLVYNWETRNKTFMSWEDGFKFDTGTLGPGDYFYIIDVDLLPPDVGKHLGGAHGVMLRQLYPERQRRPEVSLLEDIGSSLTERIAGALPTDSFGPDIGPLYSDRISSSNEKWVVKFSVPGHFFKVTVEEVTREEFSSIK